jgi:hypothetical protein
MLIIPEGVSFRFRAELKDCTGAAIPLTGYDTAVVKVKRPSPAAVLTLAATVDDAAGGLLHADATSAEMVGAGDWAAWAVITWSSGKVVKTHGAALRVVAEGTIVAGSC